MSATQSPILIAGILYEGWEADDLLAPYSVLHRAASIASGSSTTPAAKLVLLAEQRKLYSSPQGAAAWPDATFDETERVDVVLVPGGFSSPVEAANPAIIRFLRRIAPNARFVTSVCSGAAILARAGLLDGQRATTNKAFFDMLITYGPRTTWIHRARYVISGKYVTSSGVSAGIDMAFALSEQLWGKDVAAETSRQAGYVPAEWDDDPFADVHKRRNPIVAYLLSTGLHWVSPLLVSTVVGQVRKTSPKKRRIFVAVVEGLTDCLSLAHGVECWGAPMCADDFLFQFVHVHPATLTPPSGSPITALTSTGAVLECHSRLVWGDPFQPTFSVSERDVVFVPEIVALPKDQAAIAALARSLASLVDRAGFKVVVGEVASTLAGAPNTLVEGARNSAESMTGDKWIVAGRALGIASAALGVVEVLFGQTRRREVEEFVEVRK